MNRSELITFMRAQKWAVEASVSSSSSSSPQAAVIGIAISDALEIVFDTIGDTRKAKNLRANPKIALVMGWDDGKTVQIEGIADELSAGSGDDLARLKKVYLEKFPDGVERESLPGITYFRVKPTWFRFSDFTKTPPEIVEESL